MRYFFTHPPFLLTLLFILSFLTLAFSLNTSQVEAMKNICNIINPYCNPNSEPCRWDGVSCSENGGENVVRLNLSGIYIDNSNILRYVCKLAALQFLDLSGNSLKGPIPECVGSFPNLEILSLFSSNFSGSIPPSLCSLINLRTIDLSDNKLTGFIPPQLLSLSNLEDVDLSFNYLSGDIPQNFSKKLFSLRVENNSLTGTIPSAISNAQNLTYLALSNNFLNGSIPEELASCTQLKELRLHRNKLSGRIPSGIGNLPLLYVHEMYNSDVSYGLDLSHNYFTGKIPITLSNLKYIGSLDISSNMLTGEVPEALGKMSQLTLMDLSNNMLTGEIPQALENMTQLVWMDLSRNKLTGKIPDALENMNELVFLFLSRNNLTGKIPEALGNLTQLNYLDLSNNMLTGEIPKSLGDMTTLQELDLSNNMLTGEIPESLKQRQNFKLNLSNNEFVETTTVRKNNSTILIKVLGALGAVAVFIICCVVLGVLWIRKWNSREEFKQTVREILEKLEHPRISYEEVFAATNRFHNSNLLSANSFGSVYKGFFPDGTRVAVKVLNLMHEQSENMFKTECEVLQKARHRNLARIITTCSNLNFRALIFEYFSNGSLEKHLYQRSCRLGLERLLNIAIDVAHAVEYLHYDCHVHMVHCDIKPSNVLLDESMTAHLSDFGISRFLGRLTDNSVTSTIALKGSVGYIAPEYGCGGMISPPGDVYSYGIFFIGIADKEAAY